MVALIAADIPVGSAEYHTIVPPAGLPFTTIELRSTGDELPSEQMAAGFTGLTVGAAGAGATTPVPDPGALQPEDSCSTVNNVYVPGISVVNVYGLEVVVASYTTPLTE